MSTHTRNPTESQSRTDPRPTPEPTEERDAAEAEQSADAADPADATDAANHTGSWVERCQRSFSTTDTRRLRNLTDDENEAMPNPK
ncbi:hypothetical protein [Halopelagius longus]|uniref:Uncharacterized protein n=1 Tax=Halopelagius longus TaxID=1236180 RepID=A0A370IQH4_9EURY|nr:hypothetical protein [Halopelagius longus]RDI72321.1 hypothetical protein DWB78_11695 [Halopelagius longus]